MVRKRPPGRLGPLLSAVVLYASFAAGEAPGAERGGVRLLYTIDTGVFLSGCG